jgi:hypothetical protein
VKTGALDCDDRAQDVGSDGSVTIDPQGNNRGGEPIGSARGWPTVHRDLVDREFTAPASNIVWLTEHPTGEANLYLCAHKDV